MRGHTWLQAGVLVVPAAIPTLLAAAVAPAAGHPVPAGLIALVPAADCREKAVSLSGQVTLSQTRWLNGPQTQAVGRIVQNNFPNPFPRVVFQYGH